MLSPSESAERQRVGYREQKRKLLLLEKMGDLVVGQKQCFKCQKTKSLNDFYLHPQMSDGRLNKCKECTKLDTANRAIEKRTYIRKYDQWRQTTESRRAKKIGYHKNYNLRYPEKALAHHKVNNAVRAGKIKRKPCEICGAKSEAHHPDYSKPFDVQWLCFKHHRELHGQHVG